MSSADRSKIIEILMCASDICAGGMMIVTTGLCEPSEVRLLNDMATSLRIAAELDMEFDADYYEASCVEAAYRLIEADSALRGEWFGKAMPLR